MKREYHYWHSPDLGRDMELLVFGHNGAKVLMFPTRDGRFYEYEDIGIVGILADKIDAGHLQLYCVDSIAHESFYCGWCHPSGRIRRHIQYEDYILNDVLPFMMKNNQHPCTIAFGCSLGAYKAATIAFRHPHRFQKLCAFSGRYDLTMPAEHFYNLFDGYYDDNIYFHTPTHFLPQLDCESRLQYMRQMDMVFAIGKEDPFLDNNRYLSDILWSKGIPHALHKWDGRAHRGAYWRQMTRLYV
ncbi:alpha/beta hydrolase-fold protein [Methylomicrobium sp. Wu6]|uniref:esterase family protein n=1 Tax=Methylomicrobium sp. Wu6 TaxID=3107928 RepID=UPI002DD65410|nr:alpha/beta hydrolase-fold protein [Methylomicrobium sp. Wu6]MEC4747205.1 alpha/beta hydrolase-fold protein [Methylomicrobium sp. Wu6]